MRSALRILENNYIPISKFKDNPLSKSTCYFIWRELALDIDNQVYNGITRKVKDSFEAVK